MKSLSILMANWDNQDGRFEFAMGLKRKFESQNVQVEVVSIPYVNSTKNANYDSILVWQFLNIDADAYIALDLLAGSVENNNGIILLMDNKILPSYNDKIDSEEQHILETQILKNCSEKRIFANSESVSRYWQKMLSMDIKVLPTLFSAETIETVLDEVNQ